MAVQRKAGGVSGKVSVARVEDEEVVAGYAMPLPEGVPMKTASAVAAMTGKERGEVVRRVFAWMAEGHTMTAAAQACGLRPSAVRRWISGDAAWMARYERARKSLSDLQESLDLSYGCIELKHSETDAHASGTLCDFTLYEHFCSAIR